MITNQRQLQVAITALQELEAYWAGHAPDISQPIGLQARTQDIRDSIGFFVGLKNGDIHQVPISTLLDVPNLLVAARLAAGLSEEQLAERIGVTPEQVTRDEAGGYESASLERLHAVATLLGVRFSGRAELPSRDSLQPIPSREELIQGLPCVTADSPAGTAVV